MAGFRSAADVAAGFLQKPYAPGVALLAATSLALVASNTPLDVWYARLLDVMLEVRAGDFKIEKPLVTWINDGLMAVFFFVVGLELKQEIVEGELTDRRKIALPACAAFGGIVVPAAIYVGLNWGQPNVIDGWAIPTATDIAFALGVLSLLARRLPGSLRTFLLTIAIFDDVAAIVIIALYYTGDLSLSAMAFAAVVLAILVGLNRAGVRRLAPYVLLGIALWVGVLKSGVHATLAGVLVALTVPAGTPEREQPSLLDRTFDGLQPWVNFAVLPAFAFANAGIGLPRVSLDLLLSPLSVGVILGLFVGKQIGVFTFSWLAVATGLGRRPEGASWLSVYGIALLCGIGFTMSLFIGSLAFGRGGGGHGDVDRLAILIGSILSAAAGYLVLRAAARRD